MTHCRGNAGLGSREVARDGDVVPVRGQVRRMHAPWLKHAMMLDKEFYILPNVDSVVVGGTQQRGDERGGVDDADTAKIWEAAVRMCPGIEAAEPLSEWVRATTSRFAPPLRHAQHGSEAAATAAATVCDVTTPPEARSHVELHDSVTHGLQPEFKGSSKEPAPQPKAPEPAPRFFARLLARGAGFWSICASKHSIEG